MVEFLDTSNIERCIEFCPSHKKGWYRLIIEAPKRTLHGNTWEIPEEALLELIENAQEVLNKEQRTNEETKEVTPNEQENG